MTGIMTEVWQSIYLLLDFGLIISILALGEIVKKIWTSSKKRKFMKVLISSVILTIGYQYLFQIDVKIAVVSVLVSNWLYGFLIKRVIDFFSNSNFKKKLTDLFVGGHPDDDR